MRDLSLPLQRAGSHEPTHCRAHFVGGRQVKIGQNSGRFHFHLGVTIRAIPRESRGGSASLTPLPYVI